ncbi:hypothetical protein [Brevibacillus dissolubilis]|uniref:hypothetical protein n=1 Tax=Brevibacillus dissolubilis TaxID=1844116 RepID=UPI0011169678|nr:hypothetical protein [Brevibacillus dissolubilis]
MRQLFRLPTIYWALYAFVLFVSYQLVVKPAFLDGSLLALVFFLPVMGLALILPKPAERKQVLVFTIGFLILDRSLTRLDNDTTLTLIGTALVAIIGIALLARFYGKLQWNAILALVAVACLTNFTFNRENLLVLNHFTIQWQSDRLYQGEWIDYLPLGLYDVNHDNQMEIITYGNVEEVPDEPKDDSIPQTDDDRKELADELLTLKPEPLALYAFRYENGRMIRVPTNMIKEEDLARIKEQMPVDYPGFPYYVSKGDELIPQVQRQSYTEGIMQIGTSPIRAFLLDIQNIDEILKQNGGVMDQRHVFPKDSKYASLKIQNGVLSGHYEGQSFSMPTQATKILDTMQLPGGREGLIVMGEHISILTIGQGGRVEEAYSLDRKQINGLATAELIVADIDHDQTDELLVANVPSYILKPQAGGKWEILWTSDPHDKSFRFSNFARVGASQDPEIIAKARSWVSTYDRRYLSGFQYTPDGLEQTWKMYLPLINVQVGDVDGDKENEIVASVYNTHRIYVFKRHNIPVLPIAVVLSVGLLVYGVVRRFRYV